MTSPKAVCGLWVLEMHRLLCLRHSGSLRQLRNYILRVVLASAPIVGAVTDYAEPALVADAAETLLDRSRFGRVAKRYIDIAHTRYVDCAMYMCAPTRIQSHLTIPRTGKLRILFGIVTSMNLAKTLRISSGRPSWCDTAQHNVQRPVCTTNYIHTVHTRIRCCLCN